MSSIMNRMHTFNFHGHLFTVKILNNYYDNIVTIAHFHDKWKWHWKILKDLTDCFLKITILIWAWKLACVHRKLRDGQTTPWDRVSLDKNTNSQRMAYISLLYNRIQQHFSATGELSSKHFVIYVTHNMHLSQKCSTLLSHESNNI